MLAPEDVSTCSSYSKADILPSTSGTHRVHYSPQYDWDFHLESSRKDIDVSLVLPHYRARNQPIDHRMAMFVGSETGAMKLKICRPLHRQRFSLEVKAATSDVTIWLPSDFKGTIVHSGGGKSAPSYSAGFVNRIMRNTNIDQRSSSHHQQSSPATFSHQEAAYERKFLHSPSSSMQSLGFEQEDLVVVSTTGRVTFKMWDVETGKAECTQKEAFRRLLGCYSRKSPETSAPAIDWDFLLEDQ